MCLLSRLRCTLGISQWLHVRRCLSCLVILLLWILASSHGNGGIGIGSTQISGLSAVHLLLVILQRTPLALWTASLSHLLCGSNLLISRALNTPYEFPWNVSHCCLAFRGKIPNLYLVHSVHGIRGDLLCQHFLTKQDKFFCRFLPCSLSSGVFLSRPF